MRKIFGFGEWTPDLPPHLIEGLITARNVYAGPKGYRPVRDFAAITTAMPAAFKGGAAYRATDGTSLTLAGTATDLYSYTGTWNSLASGFGLGTDNRWRFAQFGDLAVCVNGGAPQKVDLISGTAGALGGSPPTAEFVFVVRDQVVLGRTDGDQTMVAWSGFNDAEYWTPATNQSGFQPLLAGGAFMGGCGGEYGVILQRGAITRMTYLGAEPWYQFDKISTNIGCDAPGSVVQAGNRIFFHSDRGFMMCVDGGEPKPIGEEKINRTFAAAYARSDYSLMYAAIDPINTLVFWSMLGRIWCYNWTQDRWTDIETSVSAIFEGFTFDTYLDALGITDIDASSIYVDDPIYQGGNPLLVVVNLSNTLGVLTGDTMAPLIERPFAEMVPGRITRTRWVRPLTDATQGVTLTIDARTRLGDSPNEETFTDLTDDGDMPVRTAARYQSQAWTIDAGTDWTFFQGAEVTFEAGGGRGA